MRRRIDRKWYNLLKEIDFSEIKDQIIFRDEMCEFETDSEIFDIIINEYIVSNGMDNEKNECTEYGRRLYMLYDLLFRSDYGTIEEK